jgi:hypothetical protein
VGSVRNQRRDTMRHGKVVPTPVVHHPPRVAHHAYALRGPWSRPATRAVGGVDACPGRTRPREPARICKSGSDHGVGIAIAEKQ